MPLPESQDLRECPTRADGSATLLAHRVSKPKCQSQQRGMFHKCFSCAWLNARVAANGPPEPATSQHEPAERNAPATQLH
jgi:hypothetical protein